MELTLSALVQIPAKSLDLADVVSANFCALSPNVVLIGFPDSVGDDSQGQFIVRSETGTLKPPLSWHRLISRGRPKLLLLARAQAALLPGERLRLLSSNGSVNNISLTDGGLASSLIDGADAAVVLGLLRFIAAKATGLLRHSEDSGLAETCYALAESVLAPDRAAHPVALCGHDLVLWALPDQTSREGVFYALNRRRLRRVQVAGDGVLLPDRRFGDGYLLPPDGPGPIYLTHPGKRLPSLGALAKRKDARSRAWHRTGINELARRASNDPESRRLLRDLQLLAPTERPHHYAQPARPFGAGLDMAISDHAGGVFLRGWIRDPMRLIAGLVLRSPYGEGALSIDQFGRFGRPDLVQKYSASPHGGAGPRPGFALHIPDIALRPVAQWSLRVELTTGDPVTLIAPPGILHAQTARDAVLGAIPPSEITPALMEVALEPAVERLHRAVMADRGLPDAIPIGELPRRPDVSVVIPLYRNLRFLRAQYAALARDRSARDVELIYVLDSPEQRAEVEHLLKGLHGIYRAPLTLLVQPGNYGYASACNAGATAARAPLLLMLNSDVIPAARGWLKPLVAAVVRHPSVAAAGPKLLFEDGSLQHAGLFFEPGSTGDWFNAHYYKGYPRHYPPAQEARRVPAVTGAALLVRRAAFEAVGGFTTDYVIGDYEDSDLCLKLRAEGGDIAYVPRAELYHFERQSIRDHAGYARTLAAAYNRRLHDRRWGAVIAQLMARVERRATRGR